MRFKIWGRTYSFLAEERQWVKLESIIDSYLVHNFFFWIAIVLFICIIFFLFLNKWDIERRYGKVCIMLYVAILFDILILCKKKANSSIRVQGISYFVTHYGFHEGNVTVAIFYLLLYVPLGYFVHRFKTKWQIKSLLVCMGIGFLLEITQYLLSRGDLAITDLVMYSVGSAIGCGIAAIRRN